MSKDIHNHDKDPIVSNDTYDIGPLTVVRLTTLSGHSAVGWAVCIPGDEYDLEKGKKIAKGRAERALTMPPAKRRYFPYMA